MAQVDLSTLPRSPKEALSRGIDKYFTGKPCPKGHVTWRYINKKKGGGGPCSLCVRPSSPDSWAAQNPEARRAAIRRYDISPKNRARQAVYRNENREQLANYHEQWRAGVAGEAGGDVYKRKRREYFSAYRNNKMATDPRYKVIKSLRDRLRKALQNAGKRKTTSVLTLAGCTKGQLVAHIESQFEEGMSWENYSWHTWHIDHIRPIATFADPEDPECWHYSNLRPRWAMENIAAGARLRWDLA